MLLGGLIREVEIFVYLVRMAMESSEGPDKSWAQRAAKRITCYGLEDKAIGTSSQSFSMCLNQ